MPYIAPEKRPDIDLAICGMPHDLDEGELNYAITQLLSRYGRHHGYNYKTLNALVGVLECAKLELYHRVISPYEDGKRSLNGDVYTNGI